MRRLSHSPSPNLNLTFCTNCDSIGSSASANDSHECLKEDFCVGDDVSGDCLLIAHLAGLCEIVFQCTDPLSVVIHRRVHHRHISNCGATFGIKSRWDWLS